MQSNFLSGRDLAQTRMKYIQVVGTSDCCCRSPDSLVPEIKDPVFTKTSQNARFLLSENERFGLVFVKTGSINSGIGFNPQSRQSARLFLVVRTGTLPVSLSPTFSPAVWFGGGGGGDTTACGKGGGGGSKFRGVDRHSGKQGIGI
jgi:hypothetical protein